MNHANLSKSKRLQRVANLLRQGGEYSTLDIVTRAQVCAVNSIISELRANGYRISCRRRGDLFLYQLEEAAA